MKQFFDEVNRMKRPKRPEMVEKDYHIHRLLCHIADNEYFSDKLLFKGGTCLIKAYTGYHRFSEDIDFTWKDERIWQETTPSQTRRRCSEEIDKIIRQLVPIARDLGMDFQGNKTDMEEVIIGGGGRMPRFYLGYHSEFLGTYSKIKMEINFVERILFPPQTKKLESYVQDIESETLSFLYKNQWKEYTKPMEIQCYDPREIYTEKCRAALTRIRYKLRDIIDIYTLQEKQRYTIAQYKPEVLKKTRFMLDIYKKYQDNIQTKEMPKEEDITEEELTLLVQQPTPELKEGIQKIHLQLEELQHELKDFRP